MARGLVTSSVTSRDYDVTIVKVVAIQNHDPDQPSAWTL